MHSVWIAALIPLAGCGLMCFGGAALAAIGLRRRSASPASEAGTGDQPSESPLPNDARTSDH